MRGVLVERYESKPFFNIGRVGTLCLYCTERRADTYRNVNELERMANPINRFLLVTGPNRILE